MRLVSQSFFLLIMMIYSNAFAKQDKILGNDIETLVRSVMNAQYGDRFNKTFGCWEYTHQVKSASIKYCVKPFESTMIHADGEERLYFYAKSIVPDNDHERVFGDFSQIDEGLLGVFILNKQASGQWDYLAKSKEIYSGSWGNCCSSPITLVKLSNADDYAWLYTSGGSWGGVFVSNFSLLLPKNGEIVDISKLPEVTEGQQDYVNKLAIESNDTKVGFYPIRLTKVEEETKKEISSELIQFNEKTFYYEK